MKKQNTNSKLMKLGLLQLGGVLFSVMLILLLLLMFAGQVQAQDTVYVSTNNTTSVVVPGMITSVDVGKHNYAITKVQKNSVLLKPELGTKSGDNTSLIIQFTDPDNGFEYFSALLICNNSSNGIVPFHYDMRSRYNRDERLAQISEEMREELYINRVKKKIDLMEQRPIDISDVGEDMGDMVMLLRAIGIDERNLYLRFEVQNNSTPDYEISTIDLSYVKRVEKGLFKKPEYQREPVSMKYGNNPITRIAGNKSEAVCFAVPLYGIKSNDYLQVMFRESVGNRNLEFKIMGKTINKYGKVIMLEEEQKH